MAMTEALLALDFLLGPAREIVVALASGDQASENDFGRALGQVHCPRKVLVTATPGTSNWSVLASRIPFLSSKGTMAGLTTAYVCEHGHCQLPVTNTTDFLRQLED